MCIGIHKARSSEVPKLTQARMIISASFADLLTYTLSRGQAGEGQRIEKSIARRLNNIDIRLRGLLMELRRNGNRHLIRNRHLTIGRFQVARVKGNHPGTPTKVSGAEGRLLIDRRGSKSSSFRGGRVPASLVRGVIPETRILGDSTRLVGRVPTLHRQRRTWLRGGANTGGGPSVGPREGVAGLPTLSPSARGIALGGDEWLGTLVVTRPGINSNSSKIS